MRYFFLLLASFLLLSGCDNERPDPASSSIPVEKAAKQPFSGDGYILRFGNDFNPGLNGVDDLGISIVIAVDTSGSMASPPATGGDMKMIQAAGALEGILSFLETGSGSGAFANLNVRLGIISFASKVTTVFPLTSMDAAGFAGLRKILGSSSALTPSGSTAIGLAIERGAEILAQSGTVLKSLIVISDGENTIGEVPERVLYAVNENRNSASTVDYPILTRGIITSFVGFDIDSGKFRNLATEGAKVTNAANGLELETVLKDFIAADISKLEAAQ